MQPACVSAVKLTWSLNISLVGCSTTHGLREGEWKRERMTSLTFALSWSGRQQQRCMMSLWPTGLTHTNTYTLVMWMPEQSPYKRNSSNFKNPDTCSLISTNVHQLKQPIGTKCKMLLRQFVREGARVYVKDRERERKRERGGGGWRLENPWQQPQSSLS